MSDTLDTAGILGEGGIIAQRLRTYESRPEQVRMAEAVARAIAEQKHLVVEAGTGVGKSFAYLVPSILAATASQREDNSPARASRGFQTRPFGGPGDEVDDDFADDRRSGSGDGSLKKKRTRIVISTHTISLQEQLIGRDIPFLNAILPLEFAAVLVKGRGNYLSLRRLKGATERAASLFVNDEQVSQLKELTQWAKETGDGSLASLNFKPMQEVWSEVQSDHGNCLSKKCPTFNDCFYFRARRRIWNAEILVVNHALFFSDLAVRREGGSILPDYDVVVLDEAHTIEAVAGEHLGTSVSNGQIDFLLNKLYNDRNQKGLLVALNYPEAQRQVVELRYKAQDYFDEVRDQQQLHGPENGRFKTPPLIATDLATPLRELGVTLAKFAEMQTKDDTKIELTAQADRCTSMAGSVEGWAKQQFKDAVYWMELSGRRQERVKLVCAPIEVGPVLRDELFNQVKTVILTSATLAVGGQDFGFVKHRLGLGASLELQLGSPFDYERNARLILPRHMPDPTENNLLYEQAVCDKIKYYVAQTQGRAFVLFTSYKMLENCARRLSNWFGSERYALYSQADGVPRTLLLDRFRQDPRGVLFGADSFWQGVDVPGDALQNVIITKLPFSVPDHPLLEARLEAIRQRGGNPFMEYQVPEAVIKLKQGFGRLIRSKSDTGQVVILDPRVRTKRYGQLFLDSLPQCRVIMDD